MQNSLYFASLIVALLAVTLRGGFPERAIVWVIFLADVADNSYHRIFGPSDFRFIDYTHLAIDTSAFLGVLWVALGANRFWPMAVCALHLIGMSGHAAVLIRVPGINQVYWAMLNIPDYLQMPVVLWGTIAHARRFARIGRYRDWRHDWRVPAFAQPA
jgi:hypothetical protein